MPETGQPGDITWSTPNRQAHLTAADDPQDNLLFT